MNILDYALTLMIYHVAKVHFHSRSLTTPLYILYRRFTIQRTSETKLQRFQRMIGSFNLISFVVSAELETAIAGASSKWYVLYMTGMRSASNVGAIVFLELD